MFVFRIFGNVATLAIFVVLVVVGVVLASVCAPALADQYLDRDSALGRCAEPYRAAAETFTCTAQLGVDASEDVPRVTLSRATAHWRAEGLRAAQPFEVPADLAEVSEEDGVYFLRAEFPASLITGAREGGWVEANVVYRRNQPGEIFGSATPAFIYVFIYLALGVMLPAAGVMLARAFIFKGGISARRGGRRR